MASFQTQIIECTVRSEIEDWFKKLIIDRFGSDVQLRYQSCEEHFNIYTQVEITARECHIEEVAKFIGNACDLLQYKLPWLHGNIYFMLFSQQTNYVKKHLAIIMKDIQYEISNYRIMGCLLTIFIFRPELEKTKIMKIDKIFESLYKIPPIFVTYPKTKVLQSKLPFCKAIDAIKGYHGTYMQYLNMEDILALEIANKSHVSGYDEQLDHDIQNYLQCDYPELYEETQTLNVDLKYFKTNEVLCYFIHKYHNCLKTIAIPNVMPPDVIQSLSQLYNIKIVCNNLIHIDFKSSNVQKSVIDFCAIYHFDLGNSYFLNYSSQYASENHIMHFNTDNTLEPFNCNTNCFSYFVIKCQNNCSPQKTNAILKCMTEHFNHIKHHSVLILYEFDLNFVPKQILSSLLKMMSPGTLEFHKMNFNISTLREILEQSAKNRILFIKCQITIENFEFVPINSQQSNLGFYDMDLNVNLINSLNNFDYIKVINCRVLSTNWDVTTEMKVSQYVLFEYTVFDVLDTIIVLMCGLESVRNVIFKSCELKSCDIVKNRNFILRNKIQFQYMIFQLPTLLKILENFEIDNRIFFKNCHFYFENIESYKFQIKPINIEFHYIEFDASTLLSFLETINRESRVTILNCCISPYTVPYTSTKMIKASCMIFEKCCLDTNVLLQIYSKLSKNTIIGHNCCRLLCSSALDTTTSANLPQMDVQFMNMTIESQFARLFLQTESEIIFDNCCLTFDADNISDTVIQSYVSFLNMKFESADYFKLLGNFSSESKMRFVNTYFNTTRLEIYDIVLKPTWIYFERTVFDFEVLIFILETISENTGVVIDECIVQKLEPIFYMLPIKIKEIRFITMRIQINTILCILKGFVNLIELGFNGCEILCTNRDHLSNNMALKPSLIWFKYMSIDVKTLQILILKCTKRMIVWIENCKITSTHSLSNAELNIGRLILKNVKYSSNVLQLLQHLSPNCSVKYLGRLSNQAIIEICTKSTIYGDRLLVNDYIYTKSFYFELFAEFYRIKALYHDFDMNAEYDLPTYLIPNFEPTINCNQYDWNEFKIKLVVVNDGTVKVEFFKNGKAVDLFFELNDLVDDSFECIVDYY